MDIDTLVELRSSRFDSVGRTVYRYGDENEPTQEQGED